MRIGLLLIVLMMRTAPFGAVPHFELVRSTPTASATLKAGPHRLQMWFTQAPAAGVSRVTLKNERGPVSGKTTIVAKEKSMYFDPAAPLSPGRYTITWRGAGDDGHVQSGAIAFAVAEKYP